MIRTFHPLGVIQKYQKLWKFYILSLTVILIINTLLIHLSTTESTLFMKVFLTCYLLPSAVYVIESILTRNLFIKFFIEIKAINLILKLSTVEHVMQLSAENLMKIILMLSLLVVQQVIISVKFIIYENFDVYL